jgi:sugar O-acyltransferase (sialic acid O-acetyltransferase NeuD family)
MTPILILGTGGTAVDILDAILARNDAGAGPAYEVVGFLDDDTARHGTRVYGVEVLGPLALARDRAEARVVNGIGSPGNFWKRGAILGRLGLPAERYETIVHPTAAVSRFARLGRGTVLLQHATVASGAVVGDHVVVLPSAIISHDCTVGDYTCLAGGAKISGNVRVGRSCYLGTGCAVRNDLAIGDEALVGMGAVVTRDVPPNTVVAGVPARPVRPTRPEGAA